MGVGGGKGVGYRWVNDLGFLNLRKVGLRVEETKILAGMHAHDHDHSITFSFQRTSLYSYPVAFTDT